MVFTILFTILPLILMLFPQKTGSKQCFSSIFCSYFHLILMLIWKTLHGLAKNHQKHMFFSWISPYFDLILTLIWPYFEVIFLNLGVCNHWFWMLFPQKTGSTHFFLFFAASFWRNLQGLAKNDEKHSLFHRLVLIWHYFWKSKVLVKNYGFGYIQNVLFKRVIS